MWQEPDPDPGGEASVPKTSREIKDLQNQNEQQQVLIAQLKEMLRKEQSTVPQEKVEEYMNTLSKVKAKKSRLKKSESTSVEKTTSSKDIRKHEKVNLLKQQLEENKAKLAERGLRQKNIEDIVSQIKTQLNNPQQSINTPVTITSIDQNLEYSKNTSSEELYTILLVKERKITDLLEKNQKQEGTILDLQENLKEKDQVIDARTKAITLMTDNLSKKGKNTLDALDETKEQMRKMQENFIILESEMKARQMILLNDLKSKNIEITELQEINKKLVEEKNESYSNIPETENHELIIKDLNNKLDESKRTIGEYTSKIDELESKLQQTIESSSELQNSEVEKLKKQLEESNKNMIKVKAQNKTKIKDLNKKLDAFKKMSDANVMIIELQNEAVKLNEKIAELEEEKGNMQLKMVESVESVKGCTHSDDLKELQDTLANHEEDILEKEKIISLLEHDIISLKTEITNLTETNLGLSHLQNEQVSTQMKSIQIEEQLESLQNDNVNLKAEIDALQKEKDEFLEKIEELNKEKLDLATKLDNYIQENMELIDKLEKLSAEKVSSAESIEIVEGLTHQEKLELAAYQKNMETNLEEPIKTQEEEPPVELNESVLQLTEDSAELLSKIEMFNVERKEVMIKLDGLREENNQLSMKLHEIENNRDILAETYEQVQTEKDQLHKENEELTQKLRELEDGRILAERVEEDTSKLFDLQKQYEKLCEENNHLKQSLKDLEEKVHEKDKLENELTETKQNLNELDSKLKESLEEITNYQSIINENKTELINSSNVINQLQTQLTEREKDITDLNTFINDLNNVINELQTANEKLSDVETMEDLRKSLCEQVEYAQAQSKEFQEELALNRSETEKQIEEIQELSKELLHKEEIISNLQGQIQDKDAKVHQVIEEMKQKYISLQKQLDNNSGSLEKQVEDLSLKNKEQLEKMKKIAANLKKKTQAYQELEKRYNGEKEKWETEVNKKESGSGAITQLQLEIDGLRQEIKSKSTTLENSEIRIKELVDTVDTLQQQNVELQNMLLETKQRQEKVIDLSLKQELSTSLHEEFDNLHSSNESTNKDKINELELIIEMNNTELNHYKERSQKLEEDLALLLKEKDYLLLKSEDLEKQLNLITRNMEERCLIEQEMNQKLQEMTNNDEILKKSLEEMTTENKDLTDKNREQEELIMKLKVKIKKAQEKVNQLKIVQSNLEEQEHLNTELKKQLVHLESTQKHIQLEYEEIQKQNQRDYERIETDYQMQLEGILKSRNELTFECEKMEEHIKALKEKEEELVMENNDYKQKLQDLDHNYNQQIVELNEKLNISSSNLEGSIQKIETLQSELNSLQKQIVSDTAKETVQLILSEAQEKIVDFNTKDTQTDEISKNDQSNINLETPAFQWAEQSEPHNWFDNREFSSSHQKPITVTKEDLENKIKALEVLLYNVDKEKEEVIGECSDMLSELTKLVYDKVHLQGIQLTSDLESQIMSAQDINAAGDPQKLHQLEFQIANESLGAQPEPVVEVVAPPTAAYLTYQPEEPIGEVESQIMSVQEIDSLKDPTKLQQLEFERSDSFIGEQSFPVVEKLVQPTKAYLTYQIGEAIGENDDGWGWGPEEARLEEEHQHRAENTPQVQALRTELEDLRTKMQSLQIEKEKHIEEINQLQIKTGKLMKKCKELKLKNDQLTKKTDQNDFFDLDQTIQEELKTQVEHLEKKIKEINTELDKEKQEKSNILKRVDVLTSANERMMEMKEIQDCEVLKWKRKYEQTSQELQWGYGDSEQGEHDKKPSPKHLAKDISSEDDIEELKKLVKDLTVDNEELQALLDDQKQQRVQLERSKSIGNETRMNNLEEELRNKELQINKIVEDQDIILKQLQNELDERNQTIKVLESQLCKENENSLIENIQRTLEERNLVVKELEERLIQTVEKKDKIICNIEEQIINKATAIQSLEENIKQLQYVNEELQVSLTEQSKKLENNAQLEELKIMLTEKTALVDQFKNSNDILNQQIQKLSNELEELKNEFMNLETDSTHIISNLQGKIEIQQEKTEHHSDTIIQELTQCRVNNVRELVELFNTEHSEYEQMKVAFAESNELNNSLSKAIKELEQQLANQQNQYHNLQVLSSKNILGLQTELEEYKQTLDQIQIENTDKLKELHRELEDYKRKCADFQSEKSEGQCIDEKLQVLAQLQSAVVEKEGNIEELKKVIEDLQKQRGDMEGEITQLKNALDRKQVELDNIITDTESKLVGTISELEQKWAQQVDERGNTVAESWKYHLSIVEADFAALKDKLKNEIIELEEKCNALVNENNELRKNVDTEIKNEVDRISALQQQINERQRSINELTQLLATEKLEKDSMAQQVSELENIQQYLADKEVELASLKTLAETTRQQFDEKRELVEEIVKILEKNTSFPLSCEKQDILNEIQRQLDASSDKYQEVTSQVENLTTQLQNYYTTLLEKDHEILRLKDEQSQLQTHLHIHQEKEAEIVRLKEESSKFQTYYNTIQEKDLEILKLNEVLSNQQEQQVQISEKNQEIDKLNHNIAQLKSELNQKASEIVALQNLVEEYKLQQNTNQQEIQNLQQQLSTANHTLEDYKQKIEEFQQSQIFLQNTVQEKNQQLSILNQQLQSTTDNKEAQKRENELIQCKEDYISLQQSLSDCQQQLFNITQDLATKSHEFNTVCQQLDYSQQNAELLQGEINKLNEMLHLKEKEYTISLENIEKTHYKELESHNDEITAAKDLDIQNLRVQVAESIYNASEQSRIRNELENQVKHLEEQVSALTKDKTELEVKLLEMELKTAEQSSLSEEETKQLNEMRGIIEEQVVKIEDLNKQLFEKSKDYDSLIAEVDISRNAITQQPVSSGSISDAQSTSRKLVIADDDLSEPVNRAELDLALYMLHQRDVRCEELTVELTHMLEERDTLQLRLSNAIREKEEIRRKYTGISDSTEQSASTSVDPGTPKSSRTSEIFLAASGTELASEPTETMHIEHDLASKLSELKQVGYKKDKTFVDEQEQRRLQQMSIMQQHIREASKLPPEAAAKLVDASYTLSRDVQSPSKVLLNWLWGRSTPRVNDT